MSAGAHELVWAVVLLEGCPDVEVVSVRVGSDSFWLGHHTVSVIDVDVHAGSQEQAETLARSLRLGEAEGRVTECEYYGPSVWRTWQGWVADGSREAAVWVRVTGSDLVAGSAVA